MDQEQFLSVDLYFRLEKDSEYSEYDSESRETMIHYTHIGHHEMNDTQLKARLNVDLVTIEAQYTSRAHNLIKDYDNWCGSGSDRYHCVHHLPRQSAVQTLL